MAALPLHPADSWCDAKSGDGLLTAFNHESNRHRFRGRTGAESPPSRRRAEESYLLDLSSRGLKFVFSGRDAGQNEKALRPEPEGFNASLSEGRVAGFRSGVAARSRCWGFRLSAAEPPHGVGAHAPEDRELCGLGFLGLAVLALVLRADKLSVNKDVIALVQRVRDGLTEAVECDDAVPLGFGLPLVVRILPRLLRRDGQHGEVRAVAADLPLLGIFPEEADELDLI